MSGCILNIILDPFFILPWGLNMGAAGAGLATFVSNCMACLYFLILARVKKGKTFVCMDIRRLWKLPPGVVKGILGVGIPASIQNLLNVTGSTILNNFTAGFGPAAVAAMGVAQKLNMVPLQIGMGFSQGVMPLVSYNYASGDRKRMKNSILFSLSVILPVMMAITLCYWVFGPGLVRSFMDNPEIVTYGAAFLRGMSLSMAFMCVDFMAVGVFQALGMGKNALIFAILRKIVLEIPLLILLNAIFPLYGLAYAQPVAEFILSIVAVIMMLRIFRQGDALQKQRL
jgi:Na+-driven multidrug efflux pump